jgi:hypothetical protein
MFLISWDEKVDKVISEDKNSSPAPLISHWRVNLQQYLDFPAAQKKQNYFQPGPGLATIGNFLSNTSEARDNFKRKLANSTVILQAKAYAVT